MSKLTWKALTTATTLADPAVHGEGYQLRYRRRKGGVFAELRYKAGAGKWTAYRLGQVPSEAETRTRFPRAQITARGQPVELPSNSVVPVELALDPIREKARELVAQLREGNDPRGAESPDSLKALIDDYLKHAVADQRPKTRAERERHLKRDWAPFHARPATSLTRAEIAARLLTLKADHGPIAANRSRATLRAMFAWAVEIGRIEAMPAFPPKALKREPRRERVLSLDELRAIWDAAGDGDHGVIVRLLILTGQRREEVGGMRWSEVNLDRALWSLPGERTKNGRPHVVPLSTQALELLRGVERKPGRDNVFGNGDGSFSGWSRSKRRLDGRAKVPSWTLHDLRRSWATHVAKLTGRVDVVEMALNHQSGVLGGVAGTYIRETFLEERERAMQAWADHLLS